jgi:hypothetical protein
LEKSLFVKAHFQNMHFTIFTTASAAPLTCDLPSQSSHDRIPIVQKNCLKDENWVQKSEIRVTGMPCVEN